MRFFVIIISILFLCNNFFAQEIITKDSYTYTDSTGNFYIQKSQPLYLWLGFTDDSTSDMHLLQSEASAEYTNPFYFDEEGLNILRSPWAVDTQSHIRIYPLEEIEFEIYADGIAPKTYLKYGNASAKNIAGKIYFGSELKIKLISSDKNSGLFNTYYSINNSKFQIYNEPILCKLEKEYLIQYYAIDNVGNIENLKKYRFTVDNSLPITELTIKGDNFENILSQRSKIVLKASDQVAGIKFIKISIDKGPVSNYKGPLLASYLKQGEHTLKYFAIDKVGNKEDEKTYTFFVDNTPPILVEEVLGNSFMNNGKEYSSGRSKLKLTAVDNKAGVKSIHYSFNDGEFQQYEKPFYLSVISGSLNITSYAVDNVNNESSASRNTSRRNVTYIDLTGPEIARNFDGPVFQVMDSIYINKNTFIKIQAVDEESGFKSMDFSIDEQEMKPYMKAFQIAEGGHHSIGATAFDNVNNSNHIDFSVVVDNTGPQIFSRFSILPLSEKEIDSEKINIYSSQVALFLSVTDARVAIDKIYYQINDKPEKQYISYIGGFKQGVDYNIKVRATDKLGNESFEKIRFITDNTGPEIFTQFSAPVRGNKQIEGKNVNIYPAYVSLFLSVTNAHVPYDKIYYSINNSNEKLYMGVIEGFKAGSDILMKIRAIDQLGNQTKKEIQFSVN